MQKLYRPPAPAWLEENKEKWTEELRDGGGWWRINYDRKPVQELIKISTNHCFYCDEYLINDGYLDDFNPDLAYEWGNMYLCCRQCGDGSKYDERLLRPDESDYDFDRYFEIDFASGQILPNRTATEHDRERAIITINIFAFNNVAKCEHRLSSLKRFQETTIETEKSKEQILKSIDESELSYRFFIKKGLEELQKNKLNYIKIKRVTIKNVRCFDDISMDFYTNKNLIVGSNSRGKTTILQLMALGLLNIEYVPFTNSWAEVVRKDTDKGCFELEIAYKDDTLTLKYAINNEDKIALISNKNDFDKLKDVLVLGYGSNRFIKYQEEKPNNFKIQPVATLFGENDYLKHIRRLNTYLQLGVHFETVKELINEIFAKSDVTNQVQLVRYDTVYKQDRPITFYFSTPTNPTHEIPLEALSDGFKATFVWLFDMVIRIVENLGNIYNRQKINGIIMIDEIDLHIHPRWQRTILPTLSDYFPNIQFIVTTHSDLVAQSVDAQYIKKLVFDDSKQCVQIGKVQYGKGSSSNFIYKDVFDVAETFDVETEVELKIFMELRNRVLQGKISVNDPNMKQIVGQLINKSRQLEQLIGQELNQIQRLKGEVFVL